MKLFVVGKGRHGKDTFCEVLKEYFNLDFVSSSEFLAEKVIYPKLSHMYGDWRECFERRHEDGMRKVWYDLITEYNKPVMTKVSEAIFSQYDIYCGIRNVNELYASLHLSDLVIWVDAEERLGDTESSESNSITIEDADIIISNNGTEEQFKLKVIRLMETLL